MHKCIIIYGHINAVLDTELSILCLRIRTRHGDREGFVKDNKLGMQSKNDVNGGRKSPSSRENNPVVEEN